jgi:cell division septum initiation protein DivIVA
MSLNAEKMKRFLAFKQELEKRIEKLDQKLQEARSMLEVIDSVILERGFQRPEIKEAPSEKEVMPVEEPAPEQERQTASEAEGIIQLKTVTGELLATLHVSDDILRVVPDKNFDMNIPPFTHFLVERVLTKMQERDNELTRTGQLTPDKMFSYDIARDGDTIREITIRNVDPERLRELKSSIRWTLEKMYEKTSSQG